MRVTYEQRKEIYNKFRKERRMKMTATLMVGLLIVGIGFLTLGCNSSVYDENGNRTFHEQEFDINGNIRNGDDRLHEEWRDIYKDVEIPHPPRRYTSVKDVPFDSEVEMLNYILEGTGFTAFRIDPNNPAHQRRYRRHLEEPTGFRVVVEEDI